MLGPPLLIGEKVFYTKHGFIVSGTVKWLGRLQEAFGNQMVAGLVLVRIIEKKKLCGFFFADYYIIHSFIRYVRIIKKYSDNFASEYLLLGASSALTSTFFNHDAYVDILTAHIKKCDKNIVK